MKTRIYVDGTITPAEEAVIPVLDRGFLYGDSVYEVFWWHHGVLVQEQEHLLRLRESGRRLYLDIGIPDDALLEAIEATVEAAELEADDDAYVRLIVTRGPGPLGLGVRAEAPTSVVVIVAPAGRPTSTQWEHGLSVVIAHRVRNPANALDPGAKTGNYLNNVLALHEARLAGADDAIMLGDGGQIAEATTANVYVVRGGEVATPPLDAGILKGTSRSRILELCHANDIPVAEALLRPEDLKRAEEIFVSSSVRGIFPVTTLDGADVADGRAGPLTRRLRDLFDAAADDEAAARRVRDVPPTG